MAKDRSIAAKTINAMSETAAEKPRFPRCYHTAPISAITHYAPIRSIGPWKNSGKMVINFAEPAREISPLKLTKNGRVRHLQGLRYTNFEKLQMANSLDEAF